MFQMPALPVTASYYFWAGGAPRVTFACSVLYTALQSKEYAISEGTLGASNPAAVDERAASPFHSPTPFAPEPCKL